MKKTITNICLFLASMLALVGQASAQNLSNKGTEFWAGYGHHQFMETGTNTQEMVIYLSAEQPATVTVSIYGTTWTQTYSVPANTVISTATIPKFGTTDARLYSGPCGFFPPGTACGGVGVFVNKAIHIESNVPIVAYAHIYGSTSSGATMLMPVETWGYSYTTINSNQNYATNCYSWAYAIAQHDNTRIEVTPSQQTRNGLPAGVPYIINLNRGDIYQVMVGNESSSAKPEMTGSKIVSIANDFGVCYPIAVFSGSSRTSGAPSACGTGGGDNDNQQSFPSQAWGKRYLTAPTSTSSNASVNQTNSYKIVRKNPSSNVYRNGTLMTPNASGFYYFQSNQPEYITSDDPIMVAQFMHGGACMGGAGNVGDPEMIYLSPLEQGIKRIGFFRNNEESISINYLTLIIPTAGVSSLVIDGSSTFTHTYPHPRLAGYSIVVRRWTSAQAQVLASSDSAFTAITYGLGSVESYGYNAGTLINNLNAVGSIRNVADTSSAVSHPYTCVNTDVSLSVLLAYEPSQIVWQLSTLAGVLSPSADVTQVAPVYTATQVINGIPYYQYDLPGTYVFSAADTFRIPLLTTHPSVENCNNTEGLYYDLIVKPTPEVDFSILHSGCISEPASFTGINPTADGHTINQWLWTFPDATTDNTSNPVKTFATPGVKTIQLSIVTDQGCEADTSKDITVSDAPITAIAPITTVACEGQPISLSSAGTATGALNYFWWDWGDGTAPVISTVDTAQLHIYTTPGTYTVSHVVGIGSVCVGDTVTTLVTVNSTPNTSFTYPAGCLPASGTVQFTSAASSPDGSAITGHLWTFGDPASGLADTSILPNPTHNYPTFGNYTITYQTTSANGCTKDTIVNAVFNLEPVLDYPVLAPVCENNAGTVSVATATVTNGVPGAGVYSGPGTDLAGNFDPAVAGVGTHTITYTYTSTAGCPATITSTIVVNPKPAAAFDATPAGCLPIDGLATFTYTGSVEAGQTYEWNFGDPTSGAANTSVLQDPTHNYTEGTYTIQLIVTNANGCKDTTDQTITYGVLPDLAYPVLTAICESEPGTVSVATATVINGVTGAGVYSGPGTDAAGNFSPSVAGAGTHTITYTFTSTGGCVGTITSTILVNPKPGADFTYTPAGCLPTDGLASFTYSGTVEPGQTYEWNFGDPASGASNTSTLANPSHNFTEGTYDVSVIVINANGCRDTANYNITYGVTPALAYGALTAACESDPGTVSVATATVTNGVTGAGVYSGPGTDAAGNFSPSVAGAGTHTITYTFTSTGGCVGTITSTILVNPKPGADFTYTPAGCLPTDGLASFTYSGTVEPGQTYEWNFGDPASGASNTSTLANPTHNFTEGTYDVSVIVINANGCRDTANYNITYGVTPALAYGALTAACESDPGTVSVATATVINGVTGAGVYSGPGTDAAGNFSPSVAGAGTHTITYTFTSTGGCVGTITSTILVNPKPGADFTYTPAGCLPTDGLASFTYSGTVEPGQTYEWNFGDPASGANNTSTLANPTHNFTEGTYDVSVIVINANGCRDTASYNIAYGVTPALAYGALTAACESDPGTVSVATATVTNGVTGAGVYSGPGTDAAGNFSPSVAGGGTHTITYTFTSTGGCVSTITSTILVTPKPITGFTATADACLGQVVTFTDNSTIASGNITSWNWNFGNGVTQTNTSNAPFDYTYPDYGTYTVTLTTTSDNGCVGDAVTQTVNIHSNPVASFTTPAFVCMPDALAFTNTSSNPDNASMTYNWDFGDGVGTSSAMNPSYNYASSGSYNITLTATTANGCVGKVTQTYDAFLDKPIALFSVTPTVLCQGTPNVFTDMSTAPNSTITSWSWNFDDGSTSTESTPSKTYTVPGNYDIVLTVQNAQGCESDPYTANVDVNVQPVVDAGPSFVVPVNAQIQFQPVVNNTSVLSFLWTPSGDITDPTVLNPSITATQSLQYLLTATGPTGCTASDSMSVQILLPVNIPNAFSPNGDGINDVWNLANLADYPGCTVEVFNRYGQKVFTSTGYPTPWDGTYKGKPLSFATYYYIIHLNNGFKPLNGTVTIIK